MSETVELQWFVAKTKAKQEKSVQRQIEELGVQTFLPVRTEIRKWSDRMKKVDTILIPNTIFIRAEKQQAFDLHNVHGVSISFVKDATRIPPSSPLIIPDGQMSDFQRFVEIAQGQYDVERDVLYQKGDKVIVTSGPFKGVVGELFRVDDHNKVVVKLDNLIACSVIITMDSIERINDLV